MRFPGTLDKGLADWLAELKGGLADAARALSAAYRRGDTSTAVSLAAYVAARVPATFAANVRVQEAVAAALPGFAPDSLLDVGTGPGTASWAAVNAWPTLKAITQCEQDSHFAGLARHLNSVSGLAALENATLLHKAEKDLPVTALADLVVASYMLAELPLETMPLVARRLWARTRQVLVLIEPGTTQGFARVNRAREVLLGQGARVIAPCTHQSPCPMAGADWCHFKVRLQRAREHMHAKQATVPFEDEAFSYLVLARNASNTAGGDADGADAGGRILSPVAISKVSATLRLCADGGVKETVIASRDKPAYKRAKKARWGDVWE